MCSFILDIIYFIYMFALYFRIIDCFALKYSKHETSNVLKNDMKKNKARSMELNFAKVLLHSCKFWTVT
jgi:hypothetical protein